MAAVWNSCAIWEKKRGPPRRCANTCFEPRDKPCDWKIIIPENEQKNDKEYKKERAVSFEPVLRVFEPEPPVKRVIDTKTPCSVPRSHYNKPAKWCTLLAAQNATHKPNLCCNTCGPLSTSLHLNEYTKRPRSKPAYKHSIFLAPDLYVGRTFPAKFRVKRLKKNCFDCGKALYFRDPVTDINNVLVLDNCCGVKVYTEEYIDNFHRVPILSIVGKEKFKKKTINELCMLEVKTILPPSPPPEDVFVSKLPQKKVKKKVKAK